LSIKNKNETVFFAGDSFSPSGIDDYCAYNRNALAEGCGFFKCLKILNECKPDYIINQHIPNAFNFTGGQFAYMENNLRERICIIKKLSAWDEINYALDEFFIMAYPYEQNGEGDVEIKINEYIDINDGPDSAGRESNIKYEIVPPKMKNKKRVYGLRVYLDGIYLGQKSCFIINGE